MRSSFPASSAPAKKFTSNFLNRTIWVSSWVSKKSRVHRIVFTRSQESEEDIRVLQYNPVFFVLSRGRPWPGLAVANHVREGVFLVKRDVNFFASEIP